MPATRRAAAAATRVLRSVPPLWRAASAARRELYARLPPRDVPGIGLVHRNDTMYRVDAASYAERGASTVDLFQARAAERGIDPRAATWFEIGCGYGRLVRVLARRVDPARVTVCDVDDDAATFCANAFGVRRVRSDRDFVFEPPVSADIVCALSVATHIPAAAFERFLDASLGAVRAGGVLLFSTHGATSLANLHVYDGGAYLRHRNELQAAFDGPGIAYRPYPVSRDRSYGMTWHRPDVVEAALRARLGPSAYVHGEPAAIDGHQDLWTVQRPS